MEQAATDMSVATGLDQSWYEAQGTFWVMRSMALQRLGTAKYGDELVITAWVSNSGCVAANGAGLDKDVFMPGGV